MLLFVKSLFKIILSCNMDLCLERCAGSIKEPLKNDVNGVEG